jgi:hypothetical protein
LTDEDFRKALFKRIKENLNINSPIIEDRKNVLVTKPFPENNTDKNTNENIITPQPFIPVMLSEIITEANSQENDVKK